MAGRDSRPDSTVPGTGVADTALEIIEQARGLRKKADFHGLRMISYLLDLVELEAHDSFRAAKARERGE